MNSHPKLISLIILAAGKSTRFGSNKLLYKLDDETMIERVVRQGLESKAQEVVVVVGYDAMKITETLKDLSCKIVHNPSFERGQSSSVITGVKFVREHAKAVMILPGDVASVRVEHINKVINEYNSTESAIVVVSYQKKMGHPILIDSELFDEILNIREGTFGLKEIISKHRSQIKMVEVGSEEVLFDVDIHDDLRLLRKK